jgi:hypothetical protein
MLAPVNMRQDSDARRIATTQPDRFVGVFLDPISTQQTTALDLFPGDVSSRSALLVDGRHADRWALRREVLDGVSTKFLIYRIHVEQDRVYLLMFFGSDSSFDEATFDSVARSVRFDQGKLRADLDAFDAQFGPSPTPDG